MLQIDSVSRRFGDFTALDQISMDIQTGEFFTLLGPSGCGKTTLLRMIAGFERPDDGNILLDGQSIIQTPPEHRPIHTVFQNYALFPHMTVFDNIAFPLRMSGIKSSEIQRRVKESLEKVSLPDKADQLPNALSGGQKQRIAIARALVGQPRLLLLDEPLSALDAKMREQMQIELINLQKQVGITFVYVTHDQSEALALSHRIAVMNHGTVAQIDQPDRLYTFPRNRFVADFIGQCNLLEGHIEAIKGHQASVSLHGLGRVQCRLPDSAHATTGQTCTLTLRPEKINVCTQLSQSDNEMHFKGQVHDLLYFGDVTVYKVELENGTLIEALRTNTAPTQGRLFEINDPVEVTWPYDAGHLVME